MSEHDQKLPWRVLVVDDNPGDVFMISEALEETGFDYTMDTVTDGASALEYLHACLPGEQWPALIILDWNLPGKNGQEVLAEMQRTPAFKALPVAIFSTCATDIDISREFPDLRTTYASKTPNFRQLIEILSRFRQFSASSARKRASASD